MEHRTPYQDFGYALTLLQQAHMSDALSVLHSLVQRFPHEPLLQVTEIEALLQTDDGLEAYNRLTHAIKLFPHYRPMMNLYAQQLMEHEHVKESVSYLKGALKLYPNDADLLKTLSQAYQAQGNTFAANCTYANYRMEIGAWREAKTLLETTQPLANTPEERAQIATALDKVKIALKNPFLPPA
ncbi:MAG: hypothetical protein V4490_07690 [Pseudomonadota bacterium]